LKKTRSQLSRIHDRNVYYVNEDCELELIDDIPNMEIREIREEASRKLPIVREKFREFLLQENRPDILSRVEGMTDEQFLLKYHPYLAKLPSAR